MNAATRLLTAVGFLAWRPWLRRRLGRVVVEEIEGVSLVVLPQVFNPSVFRTGRLLARAVSEWRPPAGVAEPHVLDLGTGSGVGSVFAARRGFRVTAVDINPAAVRCARVNAMVNGLEERIEVRHGDLLEPVQGLRFDLVVWNPPYFRGKPKSALDHAWRGEDVLERFVAGLAGVQTADGEALLVLSTDGVSEGILAPLADQGMEVGVALRQDFGNEVVTVYHLRWKGDGRKST